MIVRLAKRNESHHDVQRVDRGERGVVHAARRRHRHHVGRVEHVAGGEHEPAGDAQDVVVQDLHRAERGDRPWKALLRDDRLEQEPDVLGAPCVAEHLQIAVDECAPRSRAVSRVAAASAGRPR